MKSHATRPEKGVIFPLSSVSIVYTLAAKPQEEWYKGGPRAKNLESCVNFGSAQQPFRDCTSYKEKRLFWLSAPMVRNHI
jgi:hypothetical protein